VGGCVEPLKLSTEGEKNDSLVCACGSKNLLSGVKKSTAKIGLKLRIEEI